MAEKKFYIGSVGPLLYEDTDLIADPDGDFSGSTRQAIMTDGGIQTTKTPTDPNDVVRNVDVGSASWSKNKTFAAGNVSLDVSTDTSNKQVNQVVLTGDGGGSTLQSISNGSAGQILILEFVDSNITLEHSGTKSGGTLYLDNVGSDMTSNDEMTIGLICVGGNYWKELFTAFWNGL